MKIAFFSFIMTAMLLAGVKASAQYLHDYQGKAYTEQSYTDVDGSPYLTTNWFAGTVQLANGKNVNAKLKYDLLKDELLFQNPKDSVPMVFVDPVKGFTFNLFKIDESNLVPLVFSNGYPAADNQTPVSFYQVIADGKVKLLKYYHKIIRTDQAFNSASATKTFVLIDFYYLLAGNKIVRIKPGKKVLLAMLNDKADKIEAYLKSTGIDYKSDLDLAKLITYYNSL